MRAPRSALLASMRWNSTGWHHAALEPTKHQQIGFLEILIAAGYGVSAPKARRWPATDDDMHNRELVSTLALPMKPFISLLAT